MKILVENLAKQQLADIYYYNLNYSLKNAIEINLDIIKQIESLEKSPYIGRLIPEISDKHFREIIYKKTRHSRYRIKYYISEKSDSIYILSIINSKQDFKRFIKSHNFFNYYFNL